MLRFDGRKNNQMRPIIISRSYLKHPEGSALVEFGETKVICTASVEEKVPHFLRDANQGWVTAEYAMLPRSTDQRINRERGGANSRSLEIQRLIGRSLRAVVDLPSIEGITIRIDCDVIQADGGTRTAAISGSYVALAEALSWLVQRQKITTIPLLDYLAAVSVGLYQGEAVLDLAYVEDAAADVDMNIVMTGTGKLVEIQGSAEKDPFTRLQLEQLLDLSTLGVSAIIERQKEVLGPEITGSIDDFIRDRQPGG